MNIGPLLAFASGSTGRFLTLWGKTLLKKVAFLVQIKLCF